MKAWYVGNYAEDSEYFETGESDIREYYIRADTEQRAKEKAPYKNNTGLEYHEFSATHEPKLDGENEYITDKEFLRAGMFSWIECEECLKHMDVAENGEGDQWELDEYYNEDEYNAYIEIHGEDALPFFDIHYDNQERAYCSVKCIQEKQERKVLTYDPQ